MARSTALSKRADLASCKTDLASAHNASTQVAQQLTEKDVLRAHLWMELGIDSDNLANPLQVMNHVLLLLLKCNTLSSSTAGCTGIYAVVHMWRGVAGDGCTAGLCAAPASTVDDSVHPGVGDGGVGGVWCHGGVARGCQRAGWCGARGYRWVAGHGSGVWYW